MEDVTGKINTRTGASEPGAELLPTYSSTSLTVGVVLALSSTLLIGSSFILKKRALLRIADRGVRAGEGSYAYLKEWLWWAGFLALTGGEGANFVAYMFAPATLVTPLGGMSVIISTILSAKFLNERLNIIGKIGCVICLLGATQIVVNAPKEKTVETLDALLQLCMKPSFLLYFGFVVIAVLYLLLYVYPVAGHEHVYVPIGICSLLGSFSVIGIKGVGVGVKATLSGTANELANIEFYLFIIFVIICVGVQLNYLNRALDVFNTAIVSPIYYVCFTASVLVSSTILYQDWQSLHLLDTAMMFVSFSIISLGVILLSQFRYIDDHEAFSWQKVAKKMPGRRRTSGESVELDFRAAVPGKKGANYTRPHDPRADEANSQCDGTVWVEREIESAVEHEPLI